MLRQRRLLHPGDGALPGRSIDGSALRHVWERIDVARRQTFAALAAGQVVAEGDAIRQRLELPPPAVEGLVTACRFCDYRQLCGIDRTAS
jgi:hypothetical protein